MKGYDSPDAFRKALEARLTQWARERNTDPMRMRKRIAFDRFLARLFDTSTRPIFLLKGGYSLELRFPDHARSTRDLDLALPDLSVLEIETPRADALRSLLQETAGKEIDDGFRFAVTHGTRELTGAPIGGYRFSLTAFIGTREFVTFRLDVALADAVDFEPEWARGHELLSFAEIPPAQIALLPLEVQFSQKIHAYTLPRNDENSRVRDLADLALMVRSNRLNKPRVERALQSTFNNRNTHALPNLLPKPPASWHEEFAALAQEETLSIHTLDEAFAIVREYHSSLGVPLST